MCASTSARVSKPVITFSPFREKDRGLGFQHRGPGDAGPPVEDPGLGCEAADAVGEMAGRVDQFERALRSATQVGAPGEHLRDSTSVAYINRARRRVFVAMN